MSMIPGPLAGRELPQGPGDEDGSSIRSIQSCQIITTACRFKVQILYNLAEQDE